ncbi:DinB family protein [Emticicia fontis]
MKKILLLLLITQLAMAQSKTEPTLKSILLEQLKTTHTDKDWFVPVNIALEGVTAEQANWNDGKGNHSIGQLAHHLLFWNARVLASFKGDEVAKFDGDNDRTFTNFDKKSWEDVVKRLDVVLADLEKFVETADEAKLKEKYSTIAHIGTHNAYHTGQIIYIRKLQGSWEADKGVK